MFEFGRASILFPRPPHFAHTILLANDGTSGGGRISFSSSNHFPPSEPSVTTKPVTFPPGRGKLATKPLPTGSACRSKSVPSASSPAGLRARWLRRQRRHASLRQVATSRFTPSRRITMAGGRSRALAASRPQPRQPNFTRRDRPGGWFSYEKRESYWPLVI